jgi:hypothetical protein
MRRHVRPCAAHRCVLTTPAGACCNTRCATQRRAARGLPPGALLLLPSPSSELLVDGRGTLLLFVALVFLINTGLLRTLFWLVFVARGARARSGLCGRERARERAHPAFLARRGRGR